jgi:hypothetical protein
MCEAAVLNVMSREVFWSLAKLGRGLDGLGACFHDRILARSLIRGIYGDEF